MTALRNRLYFAYGSNLNLAQMARRCPAAQPVHPYRLADWRLVFRLGADIEPSNGNHVDGALWRITPACEDVLAYFEHNYRARVFQIDLDLPESGASRYDVMTYIRIYANGYKMPHPSYLARIRQGFEDFGHTSETLERALSLADGPEITT